MRFAWILDSVDDRLKTSVPGIVTVLLQLAEECDPEETDS